MMEKVTGDLLPEFSRLVGIMRRYGSAAVAFSGGTDSTLLLAAAMEAFNGNTLAISITAPYSPAAEVIESQQMARELGARHKIIELPLPEEIRNNPADRCYLCKRRLFSHIIEHARASGYETVFDGTNADDPGDHRPGLKALEELKVVSPLREAGLGKGMIRKIARTLGLPNWAKPANACLLTRIPHDTPVSLTDLQKIDRGEDFLRGIGFGSVRIRLHGNIARIEIPREKLPELTDPGTRKKIIDHLRNLGFEYITADLEGYRTGSLNIIPTSDE